MYVPDVALCDENGEWLGKGGEEIWCAKILEAVETFYWLVLRRVGSSSRHLVRHLVSVTKGGQCMSASELSSLLRPTGRRVVGSRPFGLSEPALAFVNAGQCITYDCRHDL